MSEDVKVEEDAKSDVFTELNKLKEENKNLKQQLQKTINEREVWKSEVVNSIYNSARQQLMTDIMNKSKSQIKEN